MELPVAVAFSAATLPGSVALLGAVLRCLGPLTGVLDGVPIGVDCREEVGRPGFDLGVAL